ncbi:hypothetical protein CDD83_8620 [Cordyceps sp. RAO-2017]|nr:hypothetical protein CDD83_8620 [Cordyceps sp. RAO-2017]
MPGSKTQSPLRERLDRVSQKYETLIVLVSESSPSGEFAGELTASGTAAFAEFACFAASLEADVTTYLVSGADQTLSAWILALLCRYNAHAAAFKRSVSLEESAWELFLRRAGLNVFAAQVLSKALVEEFGDEGLAQFLAMPTQQKLSKYQQLVGGRRVLRKCCQSLDGEDGPGLGKTHAQTT